MATIERCRRFFAEYVVHIAGSADARLIDAFAAVPRERFVGPGLELLGKWFSCAKLRSNTQVEHVPQTRPDP